MAKLQKNEISKILIGGLIVVVLAGGYAFWINRGTGNSAINPNPTVSATATPTSTIIVTSPTPAPKVYSTFVVEREGIEQVFYSIDTLGVKTRLGSASFNRAANESVAPAAITPDGATIVYTKDSDGSLMALTVSTGQSRVLKQGTVYSSNSNNASSVANFRDPVISPNGLKVAFTHYGWEWSYVEMMNIDGTGYIANTKLSGSTKDFAWSPDSLSFVKAVQRDDFGGSAQGIFVGLASSPASAKNVQPITGTVDTINYMKDSYAPSWSPDGTKIAFAYRYLDIRADRSDEANAIKYRGIYVVNADGTGFKQVTDNQSFSDTPFWLDNETIVYSLSDQFVGTKHGLYSIKTDGTLNTQIYSSSNKSYSIASISPDKNHIAFLMGTRENEYSAVSNDLRVFNRITSQVETGKTLSAAKYMGGWILK